MSEAALPVCSGQSKLVLFLLNTFLELVANALGSCCYVASLELPSFSIETFALVPVDSAQSMLTDLGSNAV